jgi:hypothetical protein
MSRPSIKTTMTTPQQSGQRKKSLAKSPKTSPCCVIRYNDMSLPQPSSPDAFDLPAMLPVFSSPPSSFSLLPDPSDMSHDLVSSPVSTHTTHTTHTSSHTMLPTLACRPYTATASTPTPTLPPRNKSPISCLFYSWHSHKLSQVLLWLLLLLLICAIIEIILVDLFFLGSHAQIRGQAAWKLESSPYYPIPELSGPQQGDVLIRTLMVYRRNFESLFQLRLRLNALFRSRHKSNNSLDE